MKNLLLAGILLLSLAACKKEKVISEIPLGNFDYLNQQHPYQGRATAQVNGEPWVGFILADTISTSKGNKRWGLQIHSFSDLGRAGGQQIISDRLHFGNLQRSAYSTSLLGSTLLSSGLQNDSVGEREFVDWSNVANDVSYTDPRIIPGEPNTITIESFDLQTGAFRGRFELTAFNPNNTAVVLHLKNGVFEGILKK